eukprot:3061036-Alexandrium_andersonii.AAC.1
MSDWALPAAMQVGAKPEEGEPERKRQRGGGASTQEDAGVKKLLTQLEARLRQVELENETHMLIGRDNEVAVHLRGVVKAYADEAKKPEKKGELGPPEFQNFLGLLSVCDNYCSRVNSAEISCHHAVLKRLLVQVRKQEVGMLTLWIKTCNI